MKRVTIFAFSLILCLSLGMCNNCYASSRKETRLSMKSIYDDQYKLNQNQKSFWKDVMKLYDQGEKGTIRIKSSMNVNDFHELLKNREVLKEVRYADTGFGTVYYSKVDDGTVEPYIDFKVLDKMIKTSKSNEKKIRKIIRKLKLNKKWTQERAARVINNYLCDNIVYDKKRKKHLLSDALNGKAVCSGYTKAFKAICKTIGLQCDYISGGNHAWNRVKINGKWKYVDVTWNDSGIKKNRYLLLPKKKFNRSHSGNLK